MIRYPSKYLKFPFPAIPFDTLDTFHSFLCPYKKGYTLQVLGSKSLANCQQLHMSMGQ